MTIYYNQSPVVFKLVHTENIIIELFVLDLQMAPVVIVLVSDGSRCLLARQAMFPRGMYSALAGFCDMGESHSVTCCCPRQISLWGYLTILLFYQLCFIKTFCRRVSGGSAAQRGGRRGGSRGGEPTVLWITALAIPTKLLYVSLPRKCQPRQNAGETLMMPLTTYYSETQLVKCIHSIIKTIVFEKKVNITKLVKKIIK